MLTEQLIDELQFLNTLESDIFNKVINYAINLIVNRQNQMKINQFIEIEEEEGDRVTALVLRLIHSLVQYKTNINDLAVQIKLIRLDKDRSDYLKDRITDNLQELRKAVFHEQLSDLTGFVGLEWRFQVELASKNYKNDYRPNVLLNFKVKQGQTVVTNLVSSDFSNLKHLQQVLSEAMRTHQSSRFKMARNSSV